MPYSQGLSNALQMLNRSLGSGGPGQSTSTAEESHSVG